MALDVKLRPEKTDLLYQEDSLLFLTLTNSGPQAVRIVDPRTNQQNFQLRVVNVKSGVETVYKKPLGAGSLPPDEEALGPRATLEAAPSLQWTAYLEPGEYDLSAIYLYNDAKEQSESKPVRVKVAATTPRNLTLESVQPAVIRGYWLNVAGESPELVRTQFDVLPGGGVRDLLRVAKAPLQAVPVPSRPPNKSVSESHWVAWIEGAAAKFLHSDKKLGTSPVRSIDLPAGEVRIVAPLHTAAPTNINVRPAGGLLVWFGDKDRRVSQLLSFTLTPDKAELAGKLDLAEPAPSWIASFERSDKKKMAVFAQAAAGVVTLSDVPWPGGGGAVRKLGEFKGQFFAAGVSPGFDDVLRGCLLVRTGVEAHHDLERIDFEIDPKGAFQGKTVGRVPCPDPADAFAKGLVRVSARGAVAVLLHSMAEKWYLYDGKAAEPLSGDLAKTRYPLDVAFLGETDPILIAGGKESGFRLVKPDGSPLPARGS